MSKYVKDQRVVVDVRDDQKWNKDVLAVLQGKSGHVGVVKTEHNDGNRKHAIDPVYLVMFDTPTEHTSRGMSHNAFWFAEHEIREAP